MIKGFTPRVYQEAILATASRHNTLIVLPTGLGKTNIFLMIAAHRLRLYPESKILLIGPTRPLIDQYLEVFRRHFEVPESEMAVLTGFVKPDKRVELWKKSRIVFSTPQGLENDVLSGRVSLSDVSLLGFDEAHRAVGDYSYVWLARRYQSEAGFPRIVGMTASPGSDSEKIMEVCNNLMIEEVEVRGDDDSDVKPYVQEIDVEYVKVDLPESFSDARDYLQKCIRSKLDTVKKYGYLNSSVGMSKTELLKLQAALHGRLARGEKDFTLMKSVSLIAEVMKASHALELLETQGITALSKYLARLSEEGRTSKVKALKNLLSDESFKSAMFMTQRLAEERVEHPKLARLREIVGECIGSAGKIIVFNQYRDSAAQIREVLNSVPGVKAELFFGQAKKGGSGLSQKEQKAMMGRFREGDFNVLIATSIGEEGLDIVNVNLVIFYEPVPSAIRSIQRRGRTGRQEKGRVIIMIARNTRDEAFRWVAHHKEKRMYRVLSTIKNKLRLTRQPGRTLSEYVDKNNEVKIFADYREKGAVTKELSDIGVDIELKTLAFGDYICSSRVAVELKSVEDFVNSIVDGRLLQQMSNLRNHYEKPVIIVEGASDIYSVRGVHPNSIRGMLATAAIDYGISVIRTANAKDTAAMILAIAKREQGKKDAGFQLHSQKPLTLRERQEFIVSSFPGVESTIAKSLLTEFKSVRGIVNASEGELKKAELIGEKKASEIRRVLDSEYGENE